MSDDSLRLSWSDVLKYAWKSIKASWTTLLTGTVTIAVLSIVLPWGGAYHFSESGWDRVMGGSATWSLLAIPVWIVGAGVWHLMRAPVDRARDVLAKQQGLIDAIRQDLTTTQYELERERAAAPVFGEAVAPQRIQGRLIRLADLPPGLWLSKNVLEGCQIVGPAKILIGGGHDHMHDNKFYGVNDRTFVVVTDLAEHFSDTIVFHDCHVSHCQFHNVTVIGQDGQIKALKAGMSGDVP